MSVAIPADMETQECFTEGFPSEGYIFSRSIDIPKNLKECLQNVETMGFKIRHALEFNIQLRNPDGHVSEVSLVMLLAYSDLRLQSSGEWFSSSPNLYLTFPFI